MVICCYNKLVVWIRKKHKLNHVKSLNLRFFNEKLIVFHSIRQLSIRVVVVKEQAKVLSRTKETANLLDLLILKFAQFFNQGR